MAAAVYVGTSGWFYDHWEGVLYPRGLPKSRRLEVYAAHFNAVEVNATFYRLPRTSTVEGWRKKAPEGFVFVAKANQEITHRRRLRKAEEPLKRFLEAIEPLGGLLANVLFQLPPSLRKDIALLEDFLVLLPDHPRASFEFRHPSWECDEVFEVLRKVGASHVVVSRSGYPFAEAHTSDIAYFRCHGPGQMFASSYSEEWLAGLAGKIAALARQGTTVFTFFNNDVAGHAVRNADTLKAHLALAGLEC